MNISDETARLMQSPIDDVMVALGCTSQTALAEVFGVTRQAVSLWKTRGRLPKWYADRLERVLQARAEKAA